MDRQRVAELSARGTPEVVERFEGVHRAAPVANVPALSRRYQVGVQPRAGGEPIIVASQDEPVHVVVDELFIYFDAGLEIRRLAK